jgi:hypothetical protein
VTASRAPGGQDTLPPMAKGTERIIIQHARRAADARRAPRDPLSWSEALAEAPWAREGLLVPWEDTYRRAYAARLVEREMALPAAPTGSTSGPSGKSLLERRTFRATEEEFAIHDERAAAAGLVWSAWARRKLLEP